MRLFVLILIVPFWVKAQSEGGIKFEKRLSWIQVLQKAKTENKYVFVDCYATWCGPCKYMDKEIYPKDTVGSVINEKFISIRMQMDTAKSDDETIKEWYSTAHWFQNQFSISALPTYLFFTADGKVVHRDVGGKSVKDFLKLAMNSFDTEKQYYTLVENYQHGKKDYQRMPYLANLAKRIGEDKFANQVSADYINNFLLNLRHEELFSLKNLIFIGSFIQSSKDKGFKLFRDNWVEIDQLTKSKYAEMVLDGIITKEQVNPYLSKAVNRKTTPDWEKIRKSIKRKFGKNYSNRIVLNAQERFYSYNKDWQELSKVYVRRYKMYGIASKVNGVINIYGVTNNMAWDIFQHNDDREIISTAVEWMYKIINEESGDQLANMMDTYANLLYKLGKVSEAIEWETKAVQIAVQHNWNNWVKQWTETIDKMKNGTPTWSVN